MLAGGCPAASNFLLLRQKNVTKEKATRSLGPFAALRATCAARLRRGSAELACGSNNCGPDPASICAARPSHTGGEQIAIPNTQRKYQDKQGHAMACPCGFRYSGLVFGCLVFLAPTPSVCAEERRFRRIRDRDCLSEASSSETPLDTSSARNRAAALTSARLSFR